MVVQLDSFQLDTFQLGSVQTVTIDGNDVTAEILDQSLRMRLRAFDIILVNPSVMPALGDAFIMVDEPYWSGTVASFKTRQVQDTLYVGVTATNENEAEVTFAPFGLSDAPNGTTTYGYADLELETTLHADSAEIRGTLKTFVSGLIPGHVFELTNAGLGYTAEPFSIADVSVSWPTADNPEYEINFGDPIVTLAMYFEDEETGIFPIDSTKITDGSVTTPKLAANAVTAAKIEAGTITANEIAAGAITTTELAVPQPGGQNLVLNSGFELADFSGAISSSHTWTAAADWTVSDVRASTNITEGTSLTMTAASY